MTLFRFIIKNLRFYARSWLIALAGMVLGTAVLTGALITGDSIHDSLRAITHHRLGSVRLALAPTDRFVRSDLAVEMAGSSNLTVVPLLSVAALVTVPGTGLVQNQAQLNGIDRQFPLLWSHRGGKEFPLPGPGEVVISQNLADKLRLIPGDFIVARLAREGFAPTNAPFTSELAETEALRLKVIAIAGDDNGGRFSLGNEQTAPYNLFVQAPALAEAMNIKGFVNQLLVSPGENDATPGRLNDLLRTHLTPADAGLLVTATSPGKFQISSRRIFIEDTLSAVIRQALPASTGTLTYLVNSLSLGTRFTPYSFVVAGGNPPGQQRSGPGEVVVNRWLADDLQARPGDTLTLSYWIMGPGQSLKEQHSRFTVSGVVDVGDDTTLRALMPAFPGLAGSGSCREWESGTPIDLSLIRDKDEAYWNRYRGTPKAWISLTDGHQAWQNRFGRYTSFAFGESDGLQRLSEAMKRLDPAALGLSFSDVYAEGLTAAEGSTDFGELFLSLGGLVVIGGLVLSAMLFGFYLENRSGELAVLRALGFSNRRIQQIMGAETLLITLAGSLAGVLLAAGYAILIVKSLNTLWQGAVHTGSLVLSLRPSTLLTGFFLSTGLNILLFAFILRKKRKKALPSSYSPYKNTMLIRKGKWPGLLLLIFLVATAIGLSANEMVSGRFYPSPRFMVSGLALMAAIITASYLHLVWLAGKPFQGKTGRTGLIARNALLNRGRTFTAILLLALGTFTVLVTGMNRKVHGTRDEMNSAGTGGFDLWMETTLPVGYPLNDITGRKKAGIDGLPGIENVQFIPVSSVPGDDASCLNLNKVRMPALTGVPAALFDSRQSFTFVNLARDAGHDHPWRELLAPAVDGVIHGIADQTAITWGMGMKVGDTLQYVDEEGRSLRVRLAGGLENSVFQGRVLIDEKMLEQAYPSSVRVRLMLIERPPALKDTLVPYLESRMRDLGTVVMPATERLAAFETVENTYLDIFVVLGALGLLTGMAGLAVLVLRSFRDRQEERELYHALGFTQKTVRTIFTHEFFLILVWGISAGIAGAGAGTLPSLLGHGASLPVVPLVMTGIIILNGIAWILLPGAMHRRSMPVRH